MSSSSVASDFPVITLSLIIGVIGGIIGIYIKLDNIGKRRHKELEFAISQKLEIQKLSNELKFLIEQSNKKIERLESIIFRLPKES